MPRKNVLILGGAGLALVVIAALTWSIRSTKDPDVLTLYGNVDLRQVELAFNNSDRIAAVEAQEGDVVRKGQELARLDTARLLPQMKVAEAQVAAQAALSAKLHAGNRPQEIAEAKAAYDAAGAEAHNAELQYQRNLSLWNASPGKAAVSRQDLDNAKAAKDAAEARMEAQKKAWDLAVLGPRREDVAQADAQLRANQAQLAVLKRALVDAALIAPVDGVIRSRLMEPGEMASPQRPVFTIAEVEPKWVRTYVNESDLVRLKPGMAASVTVDGLKGKSFAGWVGFISAVSEFTPKTVQTTDLRTSLVYEVRVFVKDPSDQLRLGAPATVTLQAPAQKAKG